LNTIDKYNHYVITSMLARVEPVVFERAEGVQIVGEDGRKYIDCFSGISVTSVGHSNPDVLAAAKEQIDKYVHCCSYVYYNKPMANLAEKLAQIAPGRLQKSFFANSGAEAVEGAMRLAKTYTQKREFIALQASFHGRTYATASITGNWARKKRAGLYMPGVSFAPVPYCYRCAFGLKPETCGMKCAEYLEDIIRYDTCGDVAAFVAEPILGEGGIIPPPEPYFKKVKEILDHHKILLIIDEVQTGFCRTGKMFAIEHYGVEPDVMTMAKGIANGFPVSAFIAPEEIANAFQPGEHLTTFGGNPVSCAASLATINFMEREKLADQVTEKGTLLKERLEAIKKNHPIIGDIRGRGLMMGIELVKDSAKTPAVDEAKAVRKMCLEKGLLVGVGGVFANVVRMQPPLTITKVELDKVVDIIEESVGKL
jgi:4-aminobutyrate aminotransferase/(S)-3-amino-2-methylpropionate transaminase